MNTSAIKNLSRPSTFWLLATIFVLSLGFHLWGIRKDLPYTHEVDEQIYVPRAVEMVAQGDLNPRWFGNPGSTTFYPLAALYHAWEVWRFQAQPLTPSPRLADRFEQAPAGFYLLGRLVSVAYSVAVLPLVYLIGKEAFGVSVALVATAFAAFYPLSIGFGQLIRTDSAATFFGLFALWQILRYQIHRRPRNLLAAGLAVGLAVSSRYFMASLALPLLWVTMPSRAEISYKTILSSLKLASVALLAVALAFVLSSPYLLFSLDTVRANLLHEARSTQLGQDGFSPGQNFLWYLLAAIPDPLAMSWPQAGLAYAGIALAFVRRQASALLLAGYMTAFLIGISFSPLHWQRWVLQILPLFALFASYGLHAVVARIQIAWPGRQVLASILLAGGVTLLAASPVFQAVAWNLRMSRPSNRILALHWIMDQADPGAAIVLEPPEIPLSAAGYSVLLLSWDTADKSFAELEAQGYQYYVMNKMLFERFQREPLRYARQLRFYAELFDHGQLAAEFPVSNVQGHFPYAIYQITGDS